MQEQLTQALMAKLEPMFYLIGVMVVLGIVSFGGTILTLMSKSKQRRDDDIAQNAVNIAKLEGKLDLFIEQSNKDLNGLGNKIRKIQA